MGDEKRLGRYVLDRKLAIGGMAEIWLAHQEGPAGFAKEIVLKRILAHLAEDPKFVEMFLDEARLAARLNHPNIAQIFDLGEADGFYFIAMEYIDGRDMQAIIERAIEVGSPVRAAIAARVVADACMALDYAHNFKDKDGTHVQLVHRDVSPQNILVSKDGIVKLVDFGVAKAATSTHKTQTGAVKGKLSYMSPEQISGKLVDARSDIFALGIVLYELVTNRRPFGHESDLLAITAILNEQPTMPREVIRQLPQELEAIILRALEKDADDRFQSASEMQVALEEVLQRMGAILTPREVREYLDDLFSDTPTGAVKALDRLASITGTPIDAAPIPGVEFTHVEHPSRETRPDHAADSHTTAPIVGADSQMVTTPVADQPEVKLAGALAAAAHRTTQPEAGATTQPDLAAPPARRGNTVGVVIALLVVLLLIITGAWFLYALLSSDRDRDARDTGVATLSTDTGTTSTQDDEERTATASAADTTSVEPESAIDGGTAAPATPPGAAANAPATAEDQATDDGDDGDAATDGTSAAAAAPDTEPADELDTAPRQTTAAIDDDPGSAPGQDTTGAEAAEPGVTEAPSSPPGEAQEGIDEPDEPRPERPRNGTIRVIVNAAGTHTVYIDGDRVGTLPGRNRFEVRAGRHTVRVDSDSGASSSHRVSIDGGETETIRIR